MNKHTHADHPLANTYGCPACAEKMYDLMKAFGHKTETEIILTADGQLEERKP